MDDDVLNGSWSKQLTLFNQGTESTLNSELVNVITTYYKNGSTISGTGYDGRDPGDINPSINEKDEVTEAVMGLSTIVTVKSDKKSSIQPEQYHRDVVAIAPCTGTSYGYSTQKNPEVFHLFVAQATWSVNNKLYTKRKAFKIAAVTTKKRDS